MSPHSSGLAETRLAGSTEAKLRRRLEDPLNHPGLVARLGARLWRDLGPFWIVRLGLSCSRALKLL